MLELKNISKIYETDGFKQKALDNVSISFRENEFVSILGPSGSGKTTLLNIIGGLDKYTKGDLIIDRVSTKKYTDRDWDTYRNHKIGFVFQSYNLIPHQSILSNVELALTLSGVGKAERKKRAKQALKKVGLEQHIHKRPNQLSGGQMQRVAIARALVNNPDILLADEPTGALDSKTSTQIMNLLQEVAKDRLVIMVTHNAELAQNYSTRIIEFKDGVIKGDTNPFEVQKQEEIVKKKNKKTSMNFKTAFILSLNNLMTKKGRTILTSFAGSIGIIGIALILSLSNGMQKYIDEVEEKTLSSYPITIEEKTLDTTELLNTVMSVQNSEAKQHEDSNKIYSNNLTTDMFSMMSKEAKANNLYEFKKYIEDESNGVLAKTNAIQYTYNLDLNIYRLVDSKYVQASPNELMSKMGLEQMAQMQSMFMGSMSTTEVFKELLDNSKLNEEQYEILAGKLPTNYDEVVLIVNENNEISDYTLYSLGFLDSDELAQKYQTLMNGGEVEEVEEQSYTYEELLKTTFKVLLNTDYYQKANGVWQDMRDNETYMQEKLEQALELKVVGIVKSKQEYGNSIDEYGCVGYTSDLTTYVINQINDTTIVKEQLTNPNIDIFTNLKFSIQNQTSYQANLATLGVVDLDTPASINIYAKNFDAKEEIASIIEDYNNEQTKAGKDENVISYTDFIGTMMSGVSSIIDIISYVLITFVSISLVVSSIMIGIITYISVLERTKEIGILRAIGASKKDVSRVFNAETLIVGLTAGIIGIVITLILNIPVNIIINHLANVEHLSKLPVMGAIVLILISVVLTVIAGLVPARIASKKEAVEALRTE